MNQKIYQLPIAVRWSDLDVNGHVRHSAYYDWGAYCRVQFLKENQLSIQAMQNLQIGPILFREEAIFRREIDMNDVVQINLQLTKARKDFSRWSIMHEVLKNDKQATIIHVDGAWINTAARKLCTPPQAAIDAFENMNRVENFMWL